MTKEVKEFPFYLEAWLWCRENSIDINQISRYNWKTWIVKYTKLK